MSFSPLVPKHTITQKAPAGHGDCCDTAHRLLLTTALALATIPGTGVGWQNSALSLHHAGPSRRSSVHATDPSPKCPTSPKSPTRASRATVPRAKGRGLQADPSRPSGWLQTTREVTTAATAAVVLCCRIPAYPPGVCVCVCVYVY